MTDCTTCGGGGFVPRVAHRIEKTVPIALPGATGLVMLEYVGVLEIADFRGPVTGTVYQFGKQRRRGYVDGEDAVLMKTNMPLVDSGNGCAPCGMAVDEIAAAVSGWTDDQLCRALDAEARNKNRSGAIFAIQREIDRRDACPQQ